MLSEYARTYRLILRELRAGAVGKLNKPLVAHFRATVEKSRQEGSPGDIVNVANFLRAQREHKVLLERYNPLVDLTAEEHIEKTAHRVGLNMPKVHVPEA